MDHNLPTYEEVVRTSSAPLRILSHDPPSSRGASNQPSFSHTSNGQDHRAIDEDLATSLSPDQALSPQRSFSSDPSDEQGDSHAHSPVHQYYFDPGGHGIVLTLDQSHRPTDPTPAGAGVVTIGQQQ
ncbi:hypothetical protein EV356DRAFT_111071 [Viridothelium virens]|uniref:Uncharacterized protein n=1 Tax=Viridothelium virens TaxID=1048519 RepID=A0A6A6HNV5_VIRVR|nr:hypothetical protein EV356DRAFT_111071 [Viridothelium virens]